jgi:hypothetical protein
MPDVDLCVYCKQKGIQLEVKKNVSHETKKIDSQNINFNARYGFYPDSNKIPFDRYKKFIFERYGKKIEVPTLETQAHARDWLEYCRNVALAKGAAR